MEKGLMYQVNMALLVFFNLLERLCITVVSQIHTVDVEKPETFDKDLKKIKCVHQVEFAL